MSSERLLLLYYPFKKLSRKKKLGNYAIASTLLLFALTFYSFAIFTSEIKTNAQGQTCQPHDEWFNFVKTIGIIDSFITIMIPFFLVLLINFAILIKMAKYKEENSNSFGMRDLTSEITNTRTFLPPLELIKSGQPQCSYVKESPNAAPSLHSFKCAELKTLNESIKIKTPSASPKEQKVRRTSFDDVNVREGVQLNLAPNISIQRSRVYWRVARVLLVISLCFLLLNLPVFFLQLSYFIGGTKMIDKKAARPLATAVDFKNSSVAPVEDTGSSTSFIELIERIVYYIYYLSFCVNFIIFDRLSNFKASKASNTSKVESND